MKVFNSKLLLTSMSFVFIAFTPHPPKLSNVDTFDIRLAGKYRLNYTQNTSKRTNGWAAYHKEELLRLNNDSTFFLELISQGGFEVLPDSGNWSCLNSTIILKPCITLRIKEVGYIPIGRIFKIVEGGLIELNGFDKKLRKALWKRE